MKKIITAAFVFLFSIQVQAGIDVEYTVSDAAGNCVGGDHGLWTNNLSSDPVTCPNYFSVDDNADPFLIVNADDDFAFLHFEASNGAVDAFVDIEFSGVSDFSSWTGSVKNGVSTAADRLGWLIFGNIVSGNIEIDGINYGVSIAGDYGFQVGMGANDKNGQFGASTWLIADAGNGPLDHWDININLASVPAPASLALFGLGLLGLGSIRRRTR